MRNQSATPAIGAEPENPTASHRSSGGCAQQLHQPGEFGCGGASRTRPSKGMNLADPGSHRIGDGRRRRLRSVPLQPVRPLSHGYKAHPLTRADALELERPAVIETAFRDWQTRVLPLDDGRELVDGPRIELGRNAILRGSSAPQCPPPINFKNEDRCSRAFTGLGLGASAEPAVCGAEPRPRRRQMNQTKNPPRGMPGRVQ
jgi:hypothetical protein